MSCTLHIHIYVSEWALTNGSARTHKIGRSFGLLFRFFSRSLCLYAFFLCNPWQASKCGKNVHGNGAQFDRLRNGNMGTRKKGLQ